MQDRFLQFRTLDALAGLAYAPRPLVDQAFLAHYAIMFIGDGTHMTHPGITRDMRYNGNTSHVLSIVSLFWDCRQNIHTMIFPSPRVPGSTLFSEGKSIRFQRSL